jgi:RNA polymerase sigma-70 factor (ECF subfamily)
MGERRAMPGQRSQTGVTERERVRPAGTLAPADAGRDDAALVLAARHDPQAFTALYKRYLHPVHRYCYLRLGGREAAEDATSEVFLKALAGLGGYRGGVFAGWLFRIADNVVNDAWRRGARGGPPPVSRDLPLELAVELSDPRTSTEALAIAHIEVEALRQALSTLPDDQRTTMEHQLAGLTTDEIAAALGRSSNAVRILRFRAQQRLRIALSTPVNAAEEPRRGGSAC